jgi:hypothetical protein
LAPALVLPLLASVCDRLGEIVIVPEFELSFSFEAGLGAWASEGADLGDPPAAWSIAVSDEAASEGVRSVRWTLDSPQGQPKIWMTRELEVAPLQAYDIALSFALATSDAAADAWRIIAGAHGAPPETSAALVLRDATAAEGAPGGALEWISKAYSIEGTSDEEGRLYLVLGLAGTSPGVRTYYLDDVRLVMTRR